jgi:hypothetical protein
MHVLCLNDKEKQMSDDLQWALGAPEVRKYSGKLVAVYQKCVVGVGSNRDSLVAEAAERAKCPWQEVVVCVVPAADLTDVPR